MKMDIEGAEAEVFAHPTPWLARVRVLVIEVHLAFRRNGPARGPRPWPRHLGCRPHAHGRQGVGLPRPQHQPVQRRSSNGPHALSIQERTPRRPPANHCPHSSKGAAPNAEPDHHPRRRGHQESPPTGRRRLPRASSSRNSSRPASSKRTSSSRVARTPTSPTRPRPPASTAPPSRTPRPTLSSTSPRKLAASAQTVRTRAATSSRTWLWPST